MRKRQKEIKTGWSTEYVTGCWGKYESDEERKQWQQEGGGGVKACSLTFDSAWQAQSIPSQLNPAQPNPTQARPKNLWASPKEALLLLLPVSFPSIRYTQGKQEGIRMGPDRHLVCWEISLGRSERLPSPLPAPAHQMWGEGHIASSLCSAAWVRSPSAFPHTGRYT